MSYTTPQLIRIHLAGPISNPQRVRDLALVLEGNTDIPFFHDSVQAGTVTVKSFRNSRSFRFQTILAEPTLQFAGGPIVRGSVHAASDTSLGIVFEENSDYVVDYDSGVLSRKEGSRISLGDPVTVWYQSYLIYQANLDYTVDESAGTIRKLAGGSMSDNEQVLLDFTPQASSVTDAIIAQAADESNAIVQRKVDRDVAFGADPLLQAAATSCALEIICRIMAARVLSSRPELDRTVTAWLKLAGLHETRSDTLLRAFSPPVRPLSKPTHS